MKNILLDAINDSTNLEQVMSTYALYKTIEEFGDYYVCFNDKDANKAKSKILEYIEAYCCKLTGSYAYSTEQNYIDELNAIITAGARRWLYNENMSLDSYVINRKNNIVKRVAYAPSFGKSCTFPLGPKNALFFELKKFNGIAASDRNTRSILSMDFGIDAEKVCHPILLLDKYPYLDTHEVEGLFIFSLFEKRDSQKQKVVEMAEESLRYRVVDYSADQLDDGEKTVDQYLATVEKSSLIITDSSAICHLAVVYKKPFIVVVSKQDAARYECLSTLEELGLMERVIYTEDDVREKKYLCRKPIRYGLVDSKLIDIRKKSIQWLKDKLV